MTQYAKVSPDGYVLSTIGLPVPGDVGPHQLSPYEDDVEGAWLRCPDGWGWQGRISETAKVAWNDGEPCWVETAQLADLVAVAVTDIDGAADAARMEVLSRQTNTEEYRRAESQARAFSAAGYPPAAVPTNVASWAAAKWRDGWTPQQAADDIIATADLWYGLLDGIRNLRLHAKEDVRHAEDGQEITARISAFKTDLSNLMKGSA